MGLTAAGQNSPAFMMLYGSHANGGGIASAITPSKINIGAVTVGADAKLESEIPKSHIPIVFMVTFIVGIMTALFCYSWNLDSIEAYDHRAHPLRKPAHIIP